MTITPTALTLDLASTAVDIAPFVVRHAQVPATLGLTGSSASPQRSDMIEVTQSTAVHVRAFMKGRDTNLGYAGYAANLTVKLAKTGDSSFSDITSGVTITDLGLGWYDILLSTTHTNTLGIANLHISGSAVFDNDEVSLNVIAMNKADSVRAGLTALPNAAAATTNGLPTTATVPNIVWDESLTAATHNVPNSAGRRLRTLGSQVLRDNTAQGAGTGNNQIQLDSGASSVDDLYHRCLITIDSGTGAGQARMILSYNGTTKVATVDHDWSTAPDATSTFQIFASSAQMVSEGLTVSATGTTIRLEASTATVADQLAGCWIVIASGTGKRQVRLITAFDQTTQTATVHKAWSTNPDTTSAYYIVPSAAIDASTQSISDIATAIWAYVIENGVSALALFRRYNGIWLAPASGLGGGTQTFRNLANTLDRAVATVAGGVRSWVFNDS